MKRLLLALSMILGGCVTGSSDDVENLDVADETQTQAVAAESAPADSSVADASNVPKTELDEEEVVISTYDRSWSDYALWGSELAPAPAEEAVTPVAPVQANTTPYSESLLYTHDNWPGYDIASVHVAAEISSENIDPVTYMVVSDGLNVRAGPSMQYPVARILKKGATIKGLNREGIWVQIGDYEYVSAVFLTQPPTVASK